MRIYIIILAGLVSCGNPIKPKNPSKTETSNLKEPKEENSIIGRWRLDSVAENGVIKNFPPNEEYDCSGFEFTKDQVIDLKQKDRIESGKPICKYMCIDDSLFYKNSYGETFMNLHITYLSKSGISLNGYLNKNKQNPSKTTLYLSKVSRRNMLCE